MNYLRPVLAYGYETRSVTTGHKEKLRVFERKVLRRIHGPIVEIGEWKL